MARRKHVTFGRRADLRQAADNLVKAGYGQSESEAARLPNQFYIGSDTESLHDSRTPAEDRWMLIWESE